MTPLGSKSGRVLVVVGVAAFAPAVVRGPDLRASIAEGVLLVVAAMGLNVAAGYAGQPSLGQGGFMAIGAYALALLRGRAGWNFVAALIVATVAGAGGAALIARAVVRLRPAFVALATWLVAWSLAFAIAAFPGVTGGAAGLVVDPARLHLRALGVSLGLNEAALMEIAFVLAVAVWIGIARMEHRYGPALAGVRSDASAARAAGIPVERVRAVALIAAGAVAALSGALLAQTQGVADPTTFAPLLSFTLFLAVVVGGPGTKAGPVVGMVVVLGLRAGAGAAARAGLSGVEALGAAVVAIVVLALGRGIVQRRGAHAAGLDPAALEPIEGARLEVKDARVRYGGVVALDLDHLVIEAGTVHAIVGGNGSGKTTLLRVVTGSIPAQARVLIDGRDVAAHKRVEAGIARTFQRTAVVPGMTALEHVLSGMEPRRSVGLWRTLLQTPLSLQENSHAQARARGLLEAIRVSDGDVGLLSAGDLRLVQVARAVASRPRVLLLDEPSAGMDRDEIARLAEVIGALRDLGCTIVLVEHDHRLVSLVADRVTVLDEGRVVRSGDPDDILEHDYDRAP